MDVEGGISYDLARRPLMSLMHNVHKTNTKWLGSNACDNGRRKLLGFAVMELGRLAWAVRQVKWGGCARRGWNKPHGND